MLAAKVKQAGYQLEIKGVIRQMCCPGCVAAASFIQGAELTDYYDFRELDGSVKSVTKEHQAAINSDQLEYQAYAKADYLAQYSRQVGQAGQATQEREADLIIAGIRCAACTWLLEKYLSERAGVKQFRVDLASHRAYLRFDQHSLDIADVFVAIGQLGYKAYPYVASIEETLYQQEKRTLLKALGVSAIGVMQVMMFTIALYAGAFEGMEAGFEQLLRWSALIVATPVVLYSARLFFVNAWRDLKKHQAGMDLPVSLAIGAAYAASLINTAWLGGEVYFESVSMFTFFLLLSRYIELTARQQRSLSTNQLVSVFPAYALRYSLDSNNEISEENVLLNQLKVGDKLRVDNGAVIPADGVIVQGSSQVDESAFSGESLPLARKVGDQVFAGSINVQNPVAMTVTSLPQQSLIANMVRLSERAGADKPPVALLADKVAGHFVVMVLLIALCAGVGWYFVAPEQVFSITLAVLVVSCPCALSLATPVALSVANRKLMLSGLMPTTSVLLTGLAQADCILFDKTGTLTDGKLQLESIKPLTDINDLQLLHIAQTLEQGVNHPVATAIVNHAQSQSGWSLTEQQVVQGAGICGVVNGKRYFLGKPAFATRQRVTPLPHTQNAICLLLADEQQPLGWLVLRDQLRDDAFAAVEQLKMMGKQLHLVSGDSGAASRFVAGQLGIQHFEGEMKPEDKIAYLQALTAANNKVLMVGDGINDAAALKQADVSVAMNSASEFVQAKADGVMLSSKVTVIAEAIELANKTRQIIRQNIAWALLYNLTAMPLAALGLIAPWLAALGMSLSSLLVLLNSYRLSRDLAVAKERS